MSLNLSEGQHDLRRFTTDTTTQRREKQLARGRHRQRYWREHDREAFECPDCGRDAETVGEIHVHHKDRNPFNGDMDNLVALCRKCHLKRHGFERRRTLDEWKTEFLELGKEN